MNVISIYNDHSCFVLHGQQAKVVDIDVEWEMFVSTYAKYHMSKNILIEQINIFSLAIRP